jgi:hypothetical protein
LKICLPTIFFVAAKCTNINSAISRQAPLALTGNKKSPRGACKNTLPATWAWQGTHAARSHVRSGGKQLTFSQQG